MFANGGAHATAPDHRLVALLRADTPTAYPALGELRGRHRHALLAYARVCANDTDAARQLGAQAFARAAREVARGVEPRGSWRHHALLLVHRTAAEWATDERRARLSPGLLTTLVPRDRDAPRAPAALLSAFHTLSPGTQTLLWHSVVDGDSDAATGIVTGMSARDVAQARGAALDALRDACLAARVARAQGTHCRGYGRLIEEATRPGRPRNTADLDAHLARCPSCTAAYLELTALRDDPRRALAEGLLPWGGTDYLLTEPPPTAPAPTVPAPQQTAPHRHRATPTTGPRADRRRRPAGGARRKAARRPSAVRATPMGFALASAAVGVLLVPLLILTLTEGRPDLSAVGQGMGATPTTPPPVRVTVTATTTATTTTTTTATATTTARSTETVTVPPSPSPTTNPPRGKPSSNPSSPPSGKPKPPRFRPPGEEYAEVIDVASGLCLDVSRTPMTDGDDVVAAKCDRTGSQQWRVDPALGVIQSAANPDFCLDNRGDTDRTIGLGHCTAADDDHGADLTFSVHGDGSIRPASDWKSAVTPLDDGSFHLGQRKFHGGDEQRWRAGESL
ncbi:ricin-type beta-trefoil lectin domain protein [Streptomyces sp. BH106]|uniref:ricin-type beta-trefoil lectin domain protein n=1 Tax=Streptomyces sp. BH106 TaxID=3410409 RepID=UPI003CF47E7D